MGDRYTVLKGGKLIDGNGGPPVEKSIIVIKGDRIEAVGGEGVVVIPPEAERSPMEAIVSATKINSEVLGIHDKLGTLEAGKLADLIVVKGDPLKNISILCDKSNIVGVYKSGTNVPRLNLP